MSASEPVFIDPYDEGRALAKAHPELMTAGLLANPAEIMGPELAYNTHDWRRFRQGALSVLMKREAS